MLCANTAYTTQNGEIYMKYGKTKPKASSGKGKCNKKTTTTPKRGKRPK